jgi:RND family efflux transporter MFP subunit
MFTMRKRGNWGFVFPLGVATSLILSGAGCQNKKNTSDADAYPAAAVSTVQRGAISHVLSVAGQFQPYQVVDVHAKVSGYLRHIYVDIGDRVHAGQTLGVLEVPELSAQYRSTQSEEGRSKDEITRAQNGVLRAKSMHAALQANFDRLRQAAKAQPGLIAEQELDDAQSKAEASQAQIDEAESTLAASRQEADVAHADMQRVGALESYTTITAPLSGVVIWRYADTGALIQAGTTSDVQSLPIIKLSQSDLLRLRLPVPEDAVGYVHEGDTVQIRVDALKRSITGKIVRFTRNVSLDTRTMETEVDVPNQNLSITPGMYANVYLQLDHKQNILTIPLLAVQRTGGAQAAVLVLNRENRVELRQVTLGVQGSLLVEIVSGLQPGERVVLGDHNKYRAAELVRPVPQQQPASDIMRQEGGMTDPQTEDAGNQ